jgi:hypothetical protein
MSCASFCSDYWPGNAPSAVCVSGWHAVSRPDLVDMGDGVHMEAPARIASTTSSRSIDYTRGGESARLAAVSRAAQHQKAFDFLIPPPMAWTSPVDY